MKQWNIFSLVLCLGAIALADEKPTAPNQLPELTPKPKSMMTSVIKLNNVKPSLMAYLLDPKNHPAPADDCLAAALDRQKFDPVTFFEVPKEIESITAVDEQSAILTRGTREGVEELIQLIKLLDMPQKKVMFDWTLYAVDAETAKKLIPDMQLGDIKLSVVRQGIFSEAVAAGRARELVTENLMTSSSRAVCSESQVKTDDPSQTSTLKMTLFPVVRGNGTIAVLLHPELKQWTIVENQSEPDFRSEMVDTIFIARDGDTVVLSVSNAKQRQNWFYAITPHIVHQIPAASPQK